MYLTYMYTKQTVVLCSAFYFAVFPKMNPSYHILELRNVNV